MDEKWISPQEREAYRTINHALEQFPIKGIKSMSLSWREISGLFFPNLHVEFYEQENSDEKS